MIWRTIEHHIPWVQGCAACSTIMLANFSNKEIVDFRYLGDYRYDWRGGLKSFGSSMKNSLEWLGSKNHRDFYEERRAQNDHWFSGMPSPTYTAKQYAFCMCSTDEEQLNVRRHLKSLEFTPTPVTYNSKNQTQCQLFIIPMKTLLKTLESY